MKLLIFSDIHNNLAAVQRLRAVEENSYDALVVAGDIGPRILDDFCAIMDTFNCPVFFVLGNYDIDDPYLKAPSSHCDLLQLQIESCHEYFFSGFSGCLLNWGQNTDYVEAIKRVEESHAPVISRLKEIKLEREDKASAIELEFGIRSEKILAKKQNIDAPTHRNALNKLYGWRNRNLEKLDEIKFKFIASRSYNAYHKAIEGCSMSVEKSSRENLIDVIKKSRVPMNRLVIVTHDRLYRLADQGVTPLLHVFGHRHAFKVTNHFGTTYLNASALDTSLRDTREGCEKVGGGYCRVTLAKGKVAVERCNLSTDRHGV